MPTKALQVLHLSPAELDHAGPRQRAGALGTAQHLSAVPCNPLDAPAHAMVASPPLTSFHLAIVDTGLPLPGDMDTIPVGDAPSARLCALSDCLSKRCPSPRCKGKAGKARDCSRSFPVLLTWSRRGETSLGQSPTCVLPTPCSEAWRAGAGLAPSPSSCLLCLTWRAPTGSVVHCLAVSPDHSPPRQPRGEV